MRLWKVEVAILFLGIVIIVIKPSSYPVFGILGILYLIYKAFKTLKLASQITEGVKSEQSYLNQQFTAVERQINIMEQKIDRSDPMPVKKKTIGSKEFVKKVELKTDTGTILVRPCCYQTARLNETYCACGRVISKQVMDYLENN